MKTGRHQVRQHEAAFLAGYLPAGSRILEIGAGTGEQAAYFARRGFAVKAIDLPTSEYSMHRVFDVEDYDGRHIPFPDASFDVVFSSNVLEHLSDLPGMLAEMRRVLRPGGYCVHAMPTPAWRIGTAVAGYADAVLFVGRKGKELPAARLLRGAAARMIPRRHGVRGNSLTELWLFRAKSWRRVFAANGYDVLDERPMGLFYTGYHVLGERLPVRARESAARVLGSACRMYVVAPHVVAPHAAQVAPSGSAGAAT